MFKKFSVSVSNRWATAGAAMAVALTSVPAFAAGEPGAIDTLFDAVDLSGIQAKVLALGLVIVGIALVFKGPSLVKRIISKI